MELRHIIELVRSWLPLLVVAVVLMAFAGFIASSLQPNVYQSKATLIVGETLSNANPNFSQLQVSQSLSTTYVAIAKTRPILTKVSEDIGGAVSPGALAGLIDVEAASDVPLLTITARDSDPERAAAIANALAARLVDASPTVQGREEAFQQSVDDALQGTQDMIASTQAELDDLAAVQGRTAQQDAELQALEARLVNLRATFATLIGLSSNDSTNRLSIVEPAIAIDDPVSPRTVLNTLLAAAIGLVAVLGIAFLTEQLDDSIKDPETVEEVSGLSTLGTIALLKGQRGRSEIYRLVGLLYPNSSTAEAYRALRSNVEFASVDAPVRSLLVTSSRPDEGKTITASNLAVVFAQGGRHVILVDADLRRPGVHTMFNLPNTQGLTTLLRDGDTSLATVVHTTEEPNLRVLTTGPRPPNPAEVLGSKRMRTLLASLLAEADLVVLDSPPLQAVADAAVLSSQVDATLVVVDAGRTRRRSLRTTKEALSRAGANVLGVVLNRVPTKSDLGYDSYYGADRTPGGAEPAQPETAPTPSGLVP